MIIVKNVTSENNYEPGSVEPFDALLLPLIFHSGQPWSESAKEHWKRITGTDAATTKVMCDHIRHVLMLMESPHDAKPAKDKP